MIVKKSPFILKNFLLLKQNIEFLPPPSDEGLNVQEIFDLYTIDIDFAIQNSPAPFFQIFIKIMVNMGEQKNIGYSIFSEGVGIFEFDKKSKIEETEIGNYLYLSGIPICVSSLRSIIANLSSNCPFGKYTLPSIDVNELIKDKGIKSLKTKKK